MRLPSRINDLNFMLWAVAEAADSAVVSINKLLFSIAKVKQEQVGRKIPGSSRTSRLRKKRRKAINRILDRL